MVDLRQPETVAAQNEESLQMVLRAIALDAALPPTEREFSLILVRCNYSRLRDIILYQLHQRCPLPLREVTLPKTARNLYTTLQRELCHEPTPTAVLVLGLEKVRSLEALMSATNQVREEFRKQFQFPLILWGNDQVLHTLTRVATDFNNWAAPPIEFARSVPELIQALHDYAERLFTQVLNTSDDRFLPNAALDLAPESLLRSELEFAVADITTSGAELNAELQATLDFLLGRDAHAQGALETAQRYYIRSLRFWQHQDSTLSQLSLAPPFSPPPLIPPVLKQACLLFHLGLSWRAYAILHRGSYETSCRYALRYFERCLRILRECDRTDLVAKFINAAQEVLQKLERWDDLAALSREALRLHEQRRDRIRQARDHGFLAEVELAQEDWDAAAERLLTAVGLLAEAERSMEMDPVTLVETVAKPLDQLRSLESSLTIAKRYHLGWYRWLLARTQRHLGQLDYAIQHLEAAQAESIPQDEPQLYIDILNLLQDLYFEQKSYKAAYAIKLQRRSVQQQFGFRAFVGAGRLVAQHRVFPTEPLPGSAVAIVAQEIAASGRQEDVRRLTGRIATPKDKLTVIHGPSGVGKSSILSAGLLPTLSGMTIEARDVVVLSLSVYTDWVNSLAHELSAQLAALGIEVTQGAIAPTTDTLLQELQQTDARNLYLVLVCDQFEEFFIHHTNFRSRQPFYTFLKTCLNLPFVKLILSIREDYLPYLLEWQRLNLDIINNDILSKEIRYPLGDFSPDDARKVIKSLTERAEFFLDTALIEALVEDLTDELGGVRPIELQVVGAELQAEQITTLADYRRKGPKEKLVQNSLTAVVEDCGPENEAVARLVLFLLTSEDGSRPLKTREELEADLMALDLEAEIAKLDLVLFVLTGSGLVFQIPESPADRYQLVHDYLVSFIRNQQGSEVARLRAELEQEREKRQLAEAERNLELEKRLLAEQQTRQALLQRLWWARVAGLVFGAAAMVAGLLWVYAEIQTGVLHWP